MNTTAKRRLDITNLGYLSRAQDFIEIYNFPVELIEDVVRHPQRIEMDPMSADSGYPIYRMIRGDIVVVVGALNPESPKVIYIHLNYPQYHGANHQKAGSGPGSKMPSSERGLRSWLIAAGCSLETGGSGHAKVYYQDTYLGSIPSTPSGGKRSIENAYSTLRRRLMAAKANEVVDEWRKTKT